MLPSSLLFFFRGKNDLLQMFVEREAINVRKAGGFTDTKRCGTVYGHIKTCGDPLDERREEMDNTVHAYDSRFRCIVYTSRAVNAQPV